MTEDSCPLWMKTVDRSRGDVISGFVFSWILLGLYYYRFGKTLDHPVILNVCIMGLVMAFVSSGFYAAVCYLCRKLPAYRKKT